MATQSRTETKERTLVDKRKTTGKKQKSSGAGVQKSKSPKVNTKVRSLSKAMMLKVPPLGSEAARNQTANKKANDIVQAIYYDINAHCNLTRAANGKDRLTDQVYHNMLESTNQFMTQELQKYMECAKPKAKLGESQPSQPLGHESRFLKFVKELGWKMFAICVHAEAFRRSFQDSNDRVWGFVCQKINDNSLSIELYAHNYGLKWRDILWKHQHDSIPGLPDMKPVIKTYMQWKVDHPSHTVITLDNKLREPKFEGKLQEHIDESIFDPLKWSIYDQTTDPTLRGPSSVSDSAHLFQVGWDCLLCGSELSCDCRLGDRAGEFVELREYPNKGTGVRTLTGFQRDDILGIFAGELLPNPTEVVYPLLQRNDSNRHEDLCSVSPHQFGNWTRYINHSCEPSTQFTIRTIGDRVVTTVEAVRDIRAFEELTVDYGVNYWGGKEHNVVSRHQNDRVNYDSLDRRSNALARGLQSVGVKRGDRVGVMLGNSMEYAVATYALFKIGAVLVPLNPSFNTTQVTAALGHLEASHLLISAESNLPRKKPRSNIPLIESLVEDLHKSKIDSAMVPSLKQIIIVDNSEGRIDTSSYKSLTPYASIASQLTADGNPLPPQHLSPDDIVNIQFTSGTTAMPKAACLSHRSILNNGSQIGDRMLLTPKDIVCCPPPLFHCFGCILGYMATATHGAAIVFPSESFNARAALEAVQAEKATALYGVPTMFLEELSLIESGEISRDGFQHLRTGIAAGSSIPAEVMKKLHRVLNLTELTICYGMTETSPVSAMTTTNDPIDKRINSVGRLMPHVEAKIVHPERKHQVLPIEARGELAVSGYLLMKEYWADPERTAEVMIPDETGKVWMHTGDEASMSPDGYISITGRIKDLIIRGGENIHPLEIENCLLAHDAVADVSVVGVPHPRYGEAVAAFVVPRDHGPNAITAEAVQQWVREKLSSHLVPKHVFFLGPLEPFPKTASGKIQKFKLKEKAIELLAKSAA
ncbi:AMP-binding enzyme [Penicillium sp. DV-2018c]|nr:AMP-binding enzyme [Penicillium sp. DV-2018c]KAJ5575959.1 AMP-binding enzyme [Penicillium sp. DV-2018c]